MENKYYYKEIIALIAGTSLTLAFAPFHLYVLAFISPALLALLWLNATPKQALWRGWLYGLGFFGTGVYWVYISIHVYGNASIFVSTLITTLFIAVLALFPALQGYLSKIMFPPSFKNNTTKQLLVFPFVWVIFEWFRSFVLTGFPWLFLGYSQLQTPLSGLAPIFGVYGVSFAVAFTATAIAAIITIIIKKQYSQIKSCVVFVSLLILIWLSSLVLVHKNWLHPVGNPIQVSLIQGNIPQELKWEPEQAPLILNKYAELTKQHWNSNLIVWPEAAIPMFSWQAQKFINDMSLEAAKHKTAIITGVPIEKDNKYYNGTISLEKESSVYLKRHLVPFGEYPFLGVLTKLFMAFLNIPMSEFTPGDQKQPPFIANNLTIAPTICYEIAYPNEILDFFPQAQLILNVSDDSWFGTSIAAAQQLEIAQMRSLETGRYQLVAGNTGITAIINSDGTIQKQIPQFQQGVLTGTVQPMNGITPWVSLGKFLNVHF